jgi:hypothetical protein
VERAITQANFTFAGQGDDVVSARLNVPVGELAGLLDPEPQFGNLGQRSGIWKFIRFYVIDVGLTVIAGVNASNLHMAKLL